MRILGALFLCGIALVRADDLVQLPQVALADVLSGAAAAAAHAALSDVGGLVVTGVRSRRDPSLGLGAVARRALEAWAACLRAGAGPGAVLSRRLGAVTRSSVVARGGWAERVPRWPARCRAAEGGDAPRFEDASGDLRETVRHAARALIAALSGGPAAPAVLAAGNGSEAVARVPLRDALDRAMHLEHLHLYEEAPGAEAPGAEAPSASRRLEALHLHTDAGLLLAFVPPVSAAGALHPVDVELPGRGVRPLAPLPEDSVCFFAGELAAALATPSPWRPLQHGLAMPAGFGWRAWYGTMLLLPGDALMQAGSRAGDGRRMTFGQFWQAARDEVSGTSATGDAGGIAQIACGGRGRLVDQPGACPAGTAQCWMTCMSTAGLESCSGQAWVPTGAGGQVALSNLSVQCADPGTGRRWPEETGQMCESCKLVCAAGSGPTPAPVLPSESAFCVLGSGRFHGTTMYMDGFRWTSLAPDETCIAFFSPYWVIDCPWKLAVACVLTILLGMSVELVSHARRRLLKSAFAERRPRWAVALAVCAQASSLALAYLVMLLVMTYSLELCLCCVLGLVLGPAATSCLSGLAASRGTGGLEQRQGLAALVEGSHAGAPCCRLAAGLDALEAGGAAGSASRTTLSVTGMTCGTCEDVVLRALQQVGGVVQARVSRSEGAAVVLHEARATADDLLRAVEGVGFGCELRGRREE